MPVTITTDTRELDRLIANTGGKIERIVADGVHYGIYGEMGTYKMAAWPFMSPAVEDVRPGFEASFKGKLTIAQVEAVVEKAARDVERIAKQRLDPHVDTGALQGSIHVETP